MSNTPEKRAARIKPLELSEILFYRNDIVENNGYPITNLSATGLGIRRKNNDYWPLKEYLDGHLKIAEQKVDVTIQIMRVSSTEIGCAFIGDTKNLKHLLYDRYNTEINALGLKKIDENILREQPDGSPHWHFDGSGGELYFVEKDHEIVRYRIHCSGLSIAGDHQGKPRISQNIDDEIIMVEIDEAVSETVMRFLNNIEKLDPGYLHRFHQIFESDAKSKGNTE